MVMMRNFKHENSFVCFSHVVTKKAYRRLVTFSEGQGIQVSGIVSPSGLRLLSQRPETRSPCLALTLTTELFINGEESMVDPANFSMGLLAGLTIHRAPKRQTCCFQMICAYVSSYILKWTVHTAADRSSLFWFQGH